MANREAPRATNVYLVDLVPGKVTEIVTDDSGNFYVHRKGKTVYVGGKNLKSDGDNGVLFAAECFNLSMNEAGSVYAVSPYATKLRILHLP